MIRLSAFMLLQYGWAILLQSCENKNTSGSMNNKISATQVTDSVRLLSVAQLQQTDSGHKAIVWFFETPQVFELELANEKFRSYYTLLATAKKNKLPVTISYLSSPEKNSIVLVNPATPAQVKTYLKEMSQRVPAGSVPPPVKQ